MTTIRWETLPESTREFIRAAALSPEGAVIEQDGRPSYRLIAYPPPPAAAPDPEWTAADNDRRCDLIDKDIDGQLTPDERVELEGLQRRLRQFVNRVAPLPLGPLRKLHQELLEKAAAANNSATP
jgi:hypothetical protein